MTSRLLRSCVGLVSSALLGLAACKDPNRIDTLSAVFADTLTVFALTGTPPSFPAAYLASAGAITRADGSFNFDVAFDIDSANNVVVYPQRFVGVARLGPKPVGLQRFTGDYESLTRAPGSGYVFDSTFTVKPGEGLVMQVQSPNECLLYFSTVHYTKMVIDSVDPGRRTVYFRTAHDPNCGYRTLVPGVVPKN